jgi:tRNA A-37 threonylcarbamoyl transferase component Bud32/tetratricopeptide (TPR) repeat protein
MTQKGGSDDRWRLVEEAFALAVETPPEERAAALDKACGGDVELRREVERLLEADERAPGFLETPAGQLWLDRTRTGDAQGPEGSDADLLAVGHVLAGRYRIQSLLGRGGMGAVYRAQDTVLGSEVAVKVLSRKRTRNAARVEAFRREVKLARRVSQPNVCRVHDIGEDGGAVFLTMEYVEGESLARRLQRPAPFDLAACQRVLRDVARGLAAAHAAGVVHRDLKPENVLLRVGTDEAVVVDFGIAAQLEDDDRTGWIVGTRGYMSPEQLAGKPVDARSDVYALGILAHQMATGRLPDACRDTATAERAAEDPSRAMPSALSGFVWTCLREDPAERPADAAAALALLEAPSALDANKPPPVTDVSGSRTRPWLRRSILVRAGLAALALLILVVGLVWLTAGPQHEPAHVAIAPLDTSPLGAGEAPVGEALRSLIRDELIDAWGVKARVEEQASGPGDIARIDGRVWREEGRPQALLRIRHGWHSRQVRAAGSSLRELAERSAALVVESSVPAAERHPTADDLRAVGTRDPEAWRLLRRARRAARMLRWDDARQLTRDAVQRDPGFALGWIEQAMTFNDGDTARDAPLTKGIELAEGVSGLDAFSSALVEFARRWRENDLAAQTRVMASFDRLPLSDEDLLYAKTRLALARSFRGDMVNGLAQMEWIAEKWPDDAAAHRALADYHLAAGEMGQLPPEAGGSLSLALRHATRAVALAPHEVGARMSLARALLLSGDKQGAKAQVDAASQAEHEEKQAANSQAENINSLFALHMALADWDEAATDARRMLMGSPARRAHGQLALGYLDLNRGAYSQGLEGLRLAVEQYAQAGRTTGAAEHSWDLCCHAYRFGRYAEARDACSRARLWSESSVSVNKEDVRRVAAASILMRLAAAQTRGEPARRWALDELRRSIAELPSDHPLRVQLELLRRYAAQDWTGVVTLYRELEPRPDSIAVAYYAAEALERLGRSDEARRVDERMASHPNAWRYPNPRVQPRDRRAADQP